jgi:hypothetical protein
MRSRSRSRRGRMQVDRVTPTRARVVVWILGEKES